MVTAAPARRPAYALAAVVLAGSTVLLGGTAWADPTPAPGTSVDQPVPEVSAPEAPVVQPSVGSWIIGGTALEATTVTRGTVPAAHPARRSVTRPALVPSRPQPAAPAALPFTGGHVGQLLPLGLALLVAGAGLTLVGRPRSVARR